MLPPAESPELGRDELDPPSAQAAGGWLWLPSRRPALGVRATAAPTMFFILLGAVLGPQGLDILTRTVLSHLQAVVWVALAVLGVLIGLGLPAIAADSARGTFLHGAIIAAITITTIAGGLYLLLSEAQIPLSGNPLVATLLIGICASVSAALQTGPGARAEVRRAARLADLDDLPLLVLGVAIVAALAGDSVVLRVLMTIAAGGAIGLAGWLLFERAHEAERAIFVTGAVLLLAGVGAYLGTSPLLSGCVASLVWVRVPGPADRITARDLRTLQHPFVALLLIIAGSLVEWTAIVLWVTGFVVVLRFAAKLLASIVAARLAGISPALLGIVLLQPGITGIALGLNAGLMLGDDASWIVSVVTTAAVAAEVLSAFLPLDRGEAS